MKKILSLLLAAVMVCTLAACSGTTPGSENSMADKSEGSNVQTESTPESKSEKTPVYKVLTNATFPPFDTIDENTGEIIGFDMDLIAAIGEDQGFQVEFVDMAFESLIPAIETGNGDIIAAGMWSGDPERIAKVDFSETYWTDGAALLVKTENTAITGLDSLTADMKVATQIATNYADDLQAMVEEGTLGEAVILDGFDTCVLQLINGDVDAVMAGASIVQAYMDKNPEALKVVGDKASYEDLGFAVQKGNAELLEKINAGLANVKENGTYDELLKKWGLA
ncbi:MAG: basic amino acid ABC transporter substrate-binding protein [Oscillospiraceae bacterium]|nr:basic amino acid ABC transporter substrate-binding protein [Oscillospiraceae bacterium]MDD7041009.1 basic amino acid ABC transporter substrate-binding protein [Oscillospiraceae bacterium]MDY2610689.1 basic amino acid ABC transporter substrate-binding protein [Oscillospiraceae bacterium]